MAAPTKTASIWGAPHNDRIPHPAKNGTITPRVATKVALPPTLSNSEALTSKPTPNSRNITPRSESAFNISLGLIQPSTLGPTSAPARISPTMPGWPKRPNNSARSLAEPKIISMARGRGRGSCIVSVLPRMRGLPRKFPPCNQARDSTPDQDGQQGHASRNQQVRPKKDSGQKILPFVLHFQTIKNQEIAITRTTNPMAGTFRDFVHVGFCVPSRRKRRISVSCRRASANSQFVPANSSASLVSASALSNARSR